MKINNLFLSLLFLPYFLSALEIKTFVGNEISPHVTTLATLCNSFFAEYPYLYSGTDEDYAEYLMSYAQSKNGILAIAFENNKPVGVAAGIPLEETWSKYHQPFKEQGYDLCTLFYQGEVALLSDYRNQGIEEQLYGKIEAFAKQLNQIKTITYMAIELPEQTVSDIEAYNAPWIKLGFKRHGEIAFENAWTDIGKSEKTSHHMVFWLKSL